MKNTMKIDNSLEKLLIIGANGFLGSHIINLRHSNERINNQFNFIASDVENTFVPNKFPFIYLDITNSEKTNKKISKLSPEVVILTAAMSNVDQCEVNKDLATKINTFGPKNVSDACKKVDSKLIYLSTDFVFDGISREGNYNENHTPNPISHYGKTKYEGEIAIINSEIKYLICRTAVLYGWNKHKLNFITWILDKLNQKEKISIVTNQINNATLVVNLAEIILKLIEKDSTGIYHTAGDGALSRYEMALKCAEIFECEKSLISPLRELEQKAKRPKNAGLNISKLKELLGSEINILNLEEGLKFMKKNRL